MDDAAFLDVLRVPVDGTQTQPLRQELDWFAHPRVRTAAARSEHVDTLVEFLATTRLALPADTAESFRAEPGVVADRSPRDAVLDRVGELRGTPALGLADLLDRLIRDAARSPRPHDSSALRRHYEEACAFAEVWVLALGDGLGQSIEPMGMLTRLSGCSPSARATRSPAGRGGTI